MSRRVAREKAFMLLYQLELQKGDEEDQINTFLIDRNVKAQDQSYMMSLVRGVRARQIDLDAQFEPLLKRWSKERLPKIDLIILRLAIFEMLYGDDVPASVAISEAVLLSKKFSSEESRSYINAILGRISGGTE
ncbi:MAG: transcription antitermination factor NusB [Saccharofermentanales bacterium]|jgi:N utilization substance protein B|nr:transcription antitermination factor NusB [Clostridiaceae bacterium]